MSELVRKRSEILFLYDVTNANPNGDPADENKPRMDERSGINFVTDVRLKRTVRDYLQDFKGLEIFVRKEEKENKEGELKTKEDIYEYYGSPDGVIDRCIDIRLFGGTFALKKKGGKKKEETSSSGESKEGKRAFALTGPVQFKFGRSLHRVGEPLLVTGTSVMPSTEEKGAGTFTEVYVLPYALICFYGIVNENAARKTRLQERDVDLLMDALWNGTKNLISRSKFGQMPRLLMRIQFKEDNFHIGELDHRVGIVKDKRDGVELADEEIRSIADIQLDLTPLAKALEKNAGRIDKVFYAIDPSLRVIKEGRSIDVESLVPSIAFERMVL